MTVALQPRPRSRAATGGAPARRAVNRWAWRLFRREWRQQALILVLLIVAVAATIIGLGVASNATHLSADPTFGTANTIVTLPGSDPQLSADLAALRQQFGPIDVIDHQTVQVPGAVLTIDVRAQNPFGPYGRVLLRLDSGPLPDRPRPGGRDQRGGPGLRPPRRGRVGRGRAGLGVSWGKWRTR